MFREDQSNKKKTQSALLQHKANIMEISSLINGESLLSEEPESQGLISLYAAQSDNTQKHHQHLMQPQSDNKSRAAVDHLNAVIKWPDAHI